jgi:hypothetical protein
MTERKNNPAEGEIVITRVFDAPRDLVWEAWTDPESLVGAEKFHGPRLQDRSPGRRCLSPLHAMAPKARTTGARMYIAGSCRRSGSSASIPLPTRKATRCRHPTMEWATGRQNCR